MFRIIPAYLTNDKIIYFIRYLPTNANAYNIQIITALYVYYGQSVKLSLCTLFFKIEQYLSFSIIYSLSLSTSSILL